MEGACLPWEAQVPSGLPGRRSCTAESPQGRYAIRSRTTVPWTSVSRK